MSNIPAPIGIFRTVETVLYFSLALIFWTNPTDVPATITKVLCPREYINISRMPQNRFPFPATIASRAINTGVEQGEEKTPPRTPAIKAPINPRFLLFDSRLAEGIKVNIPQVCKDISTINTPRIMYHSAEDVPINLPAEVAMIPSVTNVTAVPRENTAE